MYLAFTQKYQVRATVADSGLCCCVYAASFEQYLAPFFTEANGCINFVTGQICAPALPWKRRRRRRCGATCWSAWRARGWWGWCTSTSSTSPAGTAGCGEWSACDRNMTGLYNYWYIETLFLRHSPPPSPPRPPKREKNRVGKLMVPWSGSFMTWKSEGWQDIWLSDRVLDVLIGRSRVQAPCRSGWRVFLYRVDFLCWLFVLVSVPSFSLFWCVPSLCYYSAILVSVLPLSYCSGMLVSVPPPMLLQWYFGIFPTQYYCSGILVSVPPPMLLQWYFGIFPTLSYCSGMLVSVPPPMLLQWYFDIFPTLSYCSGMWKTPVILLKVQVPDYS